MTGIQAFDDIDVLDLTQSIAGPVCTQYLAILGANVVKVEPPEGDAFRGLQEGSMFASFNHGPKRSLSVDLKSDQGAELVQDLAKSADVVVESFRPGVLEQFDLDYESVAAENDDIVYCSITGFGQEGPYSEYPAYDPVVQAMTGVMSIIGYPDEPPARIGTSAIDCSTGLNAAFMVSSALRQRDRHGVGEHLDVALFDVAISWMAYWIADYSVTDEAAVRSGSGFNGIAPNNIYYAADEEPFYLCAVNQRLYERLCKTIDREELLEDERFTSNEVRWEHREVLREELESTFREYDRDALVEILAESGVPSGPLKYLPEVIQDKHVEDRGLLTSARNLRRDEDVTTVQLPVRTTDWHPELDDQPPEVGEHTREILGSLGYTDEEIKALLDGDVVFETAG